MKYRPEIDGLRAIAVLPVIFFHADFSFFKGGFIGVDVFFVISGYLITHIILNALQNETFSLAKFYERRARRILPALFTVMLISIPLSTVFLEPNHLKSFFKSVIGVSLFSSNFIFWLESSYWGIASEMKPLIHTWSLAVEEQYYFIFPLFLMLCWPFRKWVMLTLLLLATVVSLFLAQYFSTTDPDVSFFLLPTRFWEIGIGALIAFLLKFDSTIYSNIKSIPTVNNFLAGLGLTLILLSMVAFNSKTLHPGFLTLVPVLGTSMVILFATPQNRTGKILTQKWLVWIGLLSYSAYLWHQPLFAIAKHATLETPTTLTMSSLMLLTFVLSYLTYLYIETPFRNSQFLTQKKVFLFSILGSMFFILIAVFGASNLSKVSLIYSEEYALRRAYIKQAGVDRSKAVTQLACHHVKSGKLKNLDDFFDNWNCIGDSGQPYFKGKIAIFGDSHAADKSWMLRLQGFNPLQVGGTGCSLMTRKNNRCGKLLKFFHQKAVQHNVETVFIANRFSEKELTSNYIQKLLKDWSKRYQQIYLFSPMPEFPYWKKKYFRNDYLEYKPNFSTHELFYDNLSSISVPSNVHIINTAELFCPDMKHCNSIKGVDQLFLIDSTHISPEGNEVISNRLLHYIKKETSTAN